MNPFHAYATFIMVFYFLPEGLLLHAYHSSVVFVGSSATASTSVSFDVKSVSGRLIEPGMWPRSHADRGLTSMMYDGT